MLRFLTSIADGRISKLPRETLIRMRHWGQRASSRFDPSHVLAINITAATTAAVDRLLPVDRLKVAPKNARHHAAKQIRQIANSIEAFGFNVPILVDADLNVIAGHGRLLASKRWD